MLACINILLDKKELLRGADADGRNPLHFDKKELIRKADADGRNPLHFAASFGHCEEARCIMMIEEAFFAHQMDNHGLYPIHIAANEGHVDIIQAMLEYFPEAIETVNKQDENIVHLAAKNGRSKLVSFMLQQKSKFGKLINGKDTNGKTPLHLATMNSRPKVVSILILDGNVDMTIMNNESLTALDIAEKEQMNEISLPKIQREVQYSCSCSNFDHDGPLRPGFTVPGGYNGDGPYRGMAILLRKPAFIVFVICNTMALFLSIVVVVNNIWAQWGDNSLLILAVNVSAPLLGIALILMAIAFATCL
ncbi:protein ACCELERATED CELL DEATH 6-like [Macadamia integrifolia]|uniref:protein ACCELERATED CELL DEATH 6-like n=1 Tax=Macadamia integrifolia TaxID=60698 RepID=UPI001C4EB9DF|nr:protein ACCELERATED CELL DEATH 6-like [Macadamia integrifolia]